MVEEERRTVDSESPSLVVPVKPIGFRIGDGFGSCVLAGGYGFMINEYILYYVIGKLFFLLKCYWEASENEIVLLKIMITWIQFNRFYFH